MTDIQIACDSCGKIIRVSQYVKADHLACPACGAPIHKVDDGTVPKPGITRLRLRNAPADFDSTETTKTDDEWSYHEMMRSIPKSDERSRHLLHVWLSTLLFLVLGGIAYALRYHELFSNVVPYISAYGPYTLILFWIVSMHMAFKEEVFLGILCLLVPFYWIYYLFLVADKFYLRAIVAAFLVAVAVDSYHFYSKQCTATYERINTWILQGGGEIRRRRDVAEDATRNGNRRR